MKTKMKFFGMGLVAILLLYSSCAKKEYEVPYEEPPTDQLVKSASSKSRLTKAFITSVDEKKALESALASIEMLEKIHYPVTSEEQLHYALKELNTPELSKSIVNDFNKGDFPLEKAAEAFRIHYNHNPLYDWVRPIFPKLPELYPDLPEQPRNEPGACEIYRRDFPEDAANCACEVYANSIRSGHNRFQALIAGIFAARRYMLTGAC